MEKNRLDKVLLDRFETRSQAQDAIREGRVLVNGETQTKPGFPVREQDEIVVQEAEDSFVSRGGWKLKAALDTWQIDLRGKTVLDIGASTGGFTDLCLQRGASRVYALDVGHLQLSEKLKQDPRVVEMEGCNARNLEADWFDPQPDFVCMDVSFISAKTILDRLFFVWDGQEVVVLIKPQFECGPAALNRSGVLKDEKIRSRILDDMKSYALQTYMQADVIDCPLAGRSGNREALLYARHRREKV